MVGDDSLLATNPIHAEHVFRSWTAGLGRHLIDVMDAALIKSQLIEDPIKPTDTLSKIPIIRAFDVRDVPGYSASSLVKFFEEYDKVSKIVNGMEKAKKDGNVEEYFKLQKQFGDFTYYSDVSDDPINVGDQFFKIVSPYQLHTDCVTHIPGYKPYKDIIIPIAVSDDVELFYYVCEQRYKSRGTQFQRGRQNKYFPSYSNVLREKPYEEYGVENVKYGAISQEWFQKHVSENVSRSAYEGISIENTFAWSPGNAIVQDSCAIHGSSNYNIDKIKWKIGLTFHLLKADPNYGKPIDGHFYTKFSRYTKPLIEA